MHFRRLIQPDADWLDAASPRRVVLTACTGLAIYGFTVGFWRDPLMGGYVAVKLPRLIAFTLGCNGLRIGLLGRKYFLRAGISPRPRSFRQAPARAPCHGRNNSSGARAPSDQNGSRAAHKIFVPKFLTAAGKIGFFPPRASRKAPVAQLDRASDYESEG